MNNLRSQIVVQALVRRVHVAGAFALVRHHGDDDAGTILVLVNTLDGKAKLFGPTRDENFERVWEVLLEENATLEQVEAMVARRQGSDPDLWLVEIEDRKGRHFLTETVLDRG